MTRFMLAATVALLSITDVRSAWAQAAIQEPGAYAFYHPNGDVLRAGPGFQGAAGVPNAMASISSDGYGRVHRTASRRHRLNDHR